MAESNSLIDLGAISKPATVLIEKISDALGGYFKPHQIRRVAKAEADADIIKAQAEIDVTDLQRRALLRFISEEGRKQDNIETITAKAIPHLEESSAPQDVEDDWIANFFDKCRIISDEEMQSLWAKVLAGEANSPGAFSKRAVNSLGSLDKADAHLFTSLCGFVCFVGEIVPVVLDVKSAIYNDKGINFGTLTHMDDIGLISFNSLAGFNRTGFGKMFRIFYYGTPLNVHYSKEKGNDLQVGHVILTKTGRQLSLICGARPVHGFLDYIVSRWQRKGLVLSSPWPKRTAVRE